MDNSLIQYQHECANQGLRKIPENFQEALINVAPPLKQSWASLFMQ
uniref:Uncharacterized protein n=1 Tax=Rhizophora mucronata TaxID=61149 RepID=A0A2P2QCN3_RHIMU